MFLCVLDVFGAFQAIYEFWPLEGWRLARRQDVNWLLKMPSYRQFTGHMQQSPLLPCVSRRLRAQITPCTFEDFELPFLMKCFVCDYSWQSLSGYSCRKCKIKFFSINSKHRAARNLTIGLCCAHSLVFGLKIAPFWMWRMYAMGETLNFMDIVVLWRFGRWIGDTRAFSTVNWRLDAERVSSLPLFLYFPTVKTHRIM